MLLLLQQQLLLLPPLLLLPLLRLQLLLLLLLLLPLLMQVSDSILLYRCEMRRHPYVDRLTASEPVSWRLEPKH